MNRLEIALLDPTDIQLELYIEDSKNGQIRADIEDIRKKAANSHTASRILESIRQLLEQ